MQVLVHKDGGQELRHVHICVALMANEQQQQQCLEGGRAMARSRALSVSRRARNGRMRSMSIRLFFFKRLKRTEINFKFS